MIKAGIVGGTGYTGVELLRLLARHPGVEMTAITSRGEAGTPVADMFPSLRGAVGLYQQAPSPQKTNVATGNPWLDPERSLQTSIGVGQKFMEGITLDVTGFYKALTQQAIPNSASNYNPNAPRYTSTGTGTTLMKSMKPATASRTAARVTSSIFVTIGPAHSRAQRAAAVLTSV